MQAAPIPRAVRGCLVVGGILTAAYVAAYLVVRATDPDSASLMIRMYAVTMAAGREAAILDAVAAGMPQWAVFVLSVLDDVGTLLLAICLVWFVHGRLRETPALRMPIARIESQALRHRRWTSRWGLLGLAAFYFLPGFGSGILVATALGILARLPIARMAILLSVASVLVDAFWTGVLHAAYHAFPDTALLRSLPLAIVGVVLVLALVGVLQERRRRDHILLPIHAADAAARPDDGLEPAGDVVHVHLARAAQAMPEVARHRGRLLMAAELRLLPDVTREDAVRFAQAHGGLATLARAGDGDLASLGDLDRWRGHRAAAHALLAAGSTPRKGWQ